jgi:glycosyltransferase involved in cell wall biosynthesis
MPLKLLCITDSCDRPEAELFIGLHQRGVEIDVMCNPAGRNYPLLQQSGIPLLKSCFKGRFDPEGIRRIRHQLNSKDYDLIHTFDNRALQNAMLASLGINIPFVAYRGIVANVSVFDPASWLTYLNPKVKKITCVANAIRDYFLQMPLSRLVLPRDKPVTIYKGHSLAWYQDPPVDLTQFGVPAGAFVVVFTGRDRPRKGVRYLIEAANLLPPDLPIHFLLVGPMENNPKLKEQIERSPYRTHFHFAGYRTDAPAIAAAADTLIMPSVRGEGLPRSVIEAMAYGTPAIVADAGGSPELIEDGINGFIVPPADAHAIAEAILKLQSQPELRQKMGANARLHIGRDFNTSQTVEQMLALYLELCP